MPRDCNRLVGDWLKRANASSKPEKDSKKSVTPHISVTGERRCGSVMGVECVVEGPAEALEGAHDVQDDE